MPEVSARTAPTLDVPRLDTSTSFAKEAYAALKRAITAMDIYGQAQEIRLDERRLSEGLGVSRTPIREAMTLLEQEGFVRTRPRRGIYVVKKTKREIVEIITVMAALESMAARLAAERASDADIGELRRLMDDFRSGNGQSRNEGVRLDEYSDISRRVAKEAKVPLCDLRQAFVTHWKKQNPDSKSSGILTYDGNHFNDAGHQFVAEQMLKRFK